MDRLKHQIIIFICVAFSTSALIAQEPAEKTTKDNKPTVQNEESEGTLDEDGKRVIEGEAAKEALESGKDITSGRMGVEAKDKIMRGGITPPPDSDDAFKRELKNFQEAYQRYGGEIRDYQKTIDSVVNAEYKKRIAKVNQRFDMKIRNREIVERKYRVDAIKAFESFIEKYPNRKKYTPDAMFRLADLYFEKTNDDYLLADEEFQTQSIAFDEGKAPAAPVEPVRDYIKSMTVFRNLIQKWPKYRNIDGAYYLLAYSELQMGNEKVSRDLFATLISKNPKSKFIPEAWIRIGEYHFDNNELNLAKVAYSESLKFKKSKYYDKALYKLAWTDYRQDNFDQAIKGFKSLVQFSDEKKKTTGRSGSVLREESIQYIAISLAEEDWDLDGEKDPDFGIERVKRYISGDLPYEREVLTQLGEYFFDNSRYEDAISVYRFLLERYPMDRRNPEVHEKIVLTMLRDNRLDAAFSERSNLSKFYGEGSEWYQYQSKAGNVEATRYAQNIVKDNLIQSATWYHAEAQKLRTEATLREDNEMLATAISKYKRAANGYTDFLKKYPNDKDFYQWNFYLAECLYYSDQFLPAYDQYRVVREMDVPNNQYQEIAAFNAVKSMEFLIAEKVGRGELPKKTLPKGGLEDARDAASGQEKVRKGVDERDNQKRAIEAEKLATIVLKYVTSMDRYVVLGLKNPDDKYLDGKFAFQAAKIFYDYKDYPKARERFEWIVNEYPENELAYLSGSLILETYRDENDFLKLAEYAEKLGNVLKGEQAEAIRAEVREFKLGALFKSAEQLFAAGKFEKAAEEYVRLLKEDPDTKFAAKALNNAAVAYENVKRYESAMRLYKRVYVEHPKDPLAAYALYRMAINQERFFDYENAVLSYQLFYDKYRNKPQSTMDKAGLDFNLKEKRGESLQSSAVILENLQKYNDAARGYEKYVSEYPSAKGIEDVQWQAALVWEKAGKNKKMIQAIQTFISKFGNTSAQNKRVLEGLMKIADYEEKRGSKSKAGKLYKRILDEYRSRGIPAGDQAAFYAAKSEFMLVEREFAQWDRIKIKGSLKRQGKLLKTKIEGQKALNKRYESVYNYRSLEWVMAASYRKGRMLQNFAAALYDVPVPFPDGSEQAEMYRTQLEDLAIPLEDKAIETYEKMIAKSRTDKIVNEWTKRALDELNKYKPADYPLYKEERRAIQKRRLSGQPMMDASDYKKHMRPPITEPSK